MNKKTSHFISFAFFFCLLFPKIGFCNSVYFERIFDRLHLNFFSVHELRDFRNVSDFINENKKDSLRKKDTLKICAVGDIMLGTNFPNQSFLPPDDGKNLLAPVKTLISTSDLAFGNLEGTILSGEGEVKSCRDPSVCYAFKMPDHYSTYLKEAGFDMLSLANNHSRDFGNTGVKNTQRLLKELQINFAGLTDCPTSIFFSNGLKIGFTAFAPNSGTLSITDYEKLKNIVQDLDSKCDVVIVSFHGGAEGSSKKYITRDTELFLGENRGNPYKFSRVAIDAGADIVLGHGPHVPRAIEIYKGRFIAYSLGNFATYGRFSLKGNSGYAPLIDISINSKGEFLSGQIHSFIQEGEGGPKPDPSQRALYEIKALTASDFPETKLEISNEGIITFKK